MNLPWEALESWTDFSSDSWRVLECGSLGTDEFPGGTLLAVDFPSSPAFGLVTVAGRFVNIISVIFIHQLFGQSFHLYTP